MSLPHVCICEKCRREMGGVIPLTDAVLEVDRLRQEFSLAEEGLANYAQEVADLRRAYEYHRGNAERLKGRCWALAYLLYPSGGAREAVAGDLGLHEPLICPDCGVELIAGARHFSGCKSQPGEPVSHPGDKL